MEELLYLILFIIFVVLPAIGGRKKQPTGEEDIVFQPLPEEAEPTTIRRPEGSRPTSDRSDDVFAGWGGWPEEETGDEFAREWETGELEGEPVPVLKPAPPVEPRPRSQPPVRAEAPPTAPAPLPRTIPAEPVPTERWKAKVAGRSLPEVPAPKHAGDRAPARVHAALGDPPHHEPRRRHSVLRQLGSTRRVREAILLAEIIGPPRGIKEWEPPASG